MTMWRCSINLHTGRIQRTLPGSRKPWGVARKTLNLFLRSCFYNYYLRKAYGLAEVGRWLEVPLDSVVARELKQDARRGALPRWQRRGALPRWQGLGRLNREDSEKFQEYARVCAAACNLPVTVLLDNYL